jgi:AcrR family transcriptional regulator
MTDAATRQRVLDAAVRCILDRGYYRASSNEIARQAGVTWGVIQYHFGTREALMLAVLEDGARHFTDLVTNARITGETTEDRLAQLLDVLAGHYGTPEYLAYMQILLNMDHDPRTSSEVRRTLREVAEASNEQVRRLLREALGPATSQADLTTTMFLLLRGFGLSQQLLDTMAYDSLPPERDRASRQRRLAARVLAEFVDKQS